MLPDGAFLVLLNCLISGDSWNDHTAGRCCLYRAMVQVIYPYVVYPTHCHARQGVQYYCDSIQVTINGATSRCQWACHQCLPTPWPPTCSGVLPSWCTIEVAVLLVVTEEAAILDVPGRLTYTCTFQRRGKRWDHSQGAGVWQQWNEGSYSMHNPALLAKRIVKRSDGGLLPRIGNSAQTWKGCNQPP